MSYSDQYRAEARRQGHARTARAGWALARAAARA